jgi:DNA repair protein RadC
VPGNGPAIADCGRGLRGLLTLSTVELQQLVAGISTGRAAQLKAAIELGTRIARGDRPARRQVKSPTDLTDLLMLEMSHLDQEHLRTVLLDTKNRVQAITTVYIGSLNASMIRVGEIFKEALKRNSAALIVSHNHPSGDATPSREDVLVTHKIVQAGKLLDMVNRSPRQLWVQSPAAYPQARTRSWSTLRLRSAIRSFLTPKRSLI